MKPESALNQPLSPALMHALRWAMVVPASVCAWLAVLLAGMTIHEAIERAFCDRWISGLCMATWANTLLLGCICLFGGVSAVAVELAAWHTAPRAKGRVVWLVFCAGSVIALAMNGFHLEWAALAFTGVPVAAGLAAALFLTGAWKRRVPTERIA